MKYLFSDHERIKKELKGKFIYLFLDYDGTLSPIAESPGKAVMPRKTKDLLRKLSKMPDRKIAIVSGRALADISKRVGLKNIVYVGNHGFEIKGPKIEFKSPAPIRYKKALEEIKARLSANLSSVRGVYIEDKGFSLSVHYRLVDKKRAPLVKSEFFSAVLLHELRNTVNVKPGKMVLEVRPPVPWDKGKAVLWLLGRRLFAMRDRKKKVLPVYIGDDITDEDAFKSLKGRGITISVGKADRTTARYYVRDTEEVAMFLEAVSMV
ncbi:MAG: trehalose-phosphatase [Candidatus Omnitrophota bacterium]|nr:trehalose-phosphatase [Candidatus Omnitrophota bacterium]